VAELALVYVHGAGPQKAAPQLKQELDRILFRREMASTRVAHYSEVRWPPGPGDGQRTLGPDRSGRGGRVQAVRLASQPGLGPKAAAAVIVGATLAPAAGSRARGRGIAAGPEPAAPPADAVRLVEQLYRRADRVAPRSSAGRPGLALTPSIPDPIFRLIVGSFASDVVDYLFGGYAERMRAPVRKALLDGPEPGVVVAHSLGTIITYDVLSEPAFAGLRVSLFTLGSPLGIGNIQDRLRDRAGRPNPVPAPVKTWSNFADRWDPVALDPTLRHEFDPGGGLIRDEAVNNPAKNNHDLTGYLGVALVQAAIATAVGQS
jgi:hypothetical protein